jgi:hypothetical protein
MEEHTMKFVHKEAAEQFDDSGERVVDIEWRDAAGNAPVSEADRTAWVNELVEDMLRFNTDDMPFTRYICSGDSMVIVVRDEDDLEVFDCKIRRIARVTED